MNIKEQVVKTVVKSGNGGAVWVPKKWLGQQVIVILPEKEILTIKEKIVGILLPYLQDIEAAFLYGSYARNEHTVDSDLDVLVITKRKMKIGILEDNVELNAVTLKGLIKAIKKNPVFYQIIREAKPIINSVLLEQLKKVKINFKNFRHFVETTKEHIKSNEELLELDKLDNDFLKSYSVVYSITLRLRVVFIVRCIINNKFFSNKYFKNWILSKKITRDEYEQAYKIYRLIRDGKKIEGVKFKINSADKLLNLLKNEILDLERKLYGKQKKKA